ncbi:MAG: DUF58 domain-containing protein [Lachnospiraceae bacterium]|nr:DUF58 domain-containing protein [Lachnospiraceae bacterium]
MRRNRIILLLLWILSLIAISYYGGAVSYGFFIVLTLIPVVSLLYLILVILQFRIYQRLEGKAVIANRTSDFYFTLQNEGLMAFAGIRVLFYSTFSTIAGLSDEIEYELLPKTGIRRQTKVVCRYRGEYDIGIKKIVARDFFRLFTITYHNREPLRIMVKPNIVQVMHLKSAAHVLSAARQSQANRSEPDVLVRDYAPGDDIRFMHWNASATSGKLMVRERIGEQQQGIAVILNSKRQNHTIEDYLPVENKMIEIVLALTLYFCKANIPVSVYCMTGIAGGAAGGLTSGGLQGLSISHVSEQRQFDAFYEQMAGFAFDERKDAASLYAQVIAAGEIFTKKSAFLVTHTFGEAEEHFASELSKGQLATMIYRVSKTHDGNEALLRVVDAGESSAANRKFACAESLPPRCDLAVIASDADLTEVL